MLKMLYLIVAFLVLTNLVLCASTANFGKDGVYQCLSKHEIPFNLDAVEIIDSPHPELKVEGLKEFPLATKIFNNGYTVVVQMTFETNVPTLAAGPLQSAAIYQLQQLQFYWHKDSAVDMELHVVFFNTNYTSFEEASLEQFGVAAIAANLRVASDSNGTFEHWSKNLVNIREPFKEFSLPQHAMYTLGDYLDMDLEAYYFYNGSLMAPNCNEDVIWIDLFRRIEIGTETFENFASLKTFDGSSLSSNFFRSSQPLQNRQVFKSTPPLGTPPKENSSNSSIIPLVNGMNAASKCFSDFIKIISVVNIIWTLFSK